jgi:hypothetical protein
MVGVNHPLRISDAGDRFSSRRTRRGTTRRRVELRLEHIPAVRTEVPAVVFDFANLNEFGLRQRN